MRRGYENGLGQYERAQYREPKQNTFMLIVEYFPH
jgi:hypothetical protein